MKTVVFDIDGVLADWSTGFSNLANSIYPDVPVVTHMECESWDVRPGMTREMERVTWDLVKQDARFWAGLEPLARPEEFEKIERLILDGNRVYFATNRNSPGALLNTKWWLFLHIGAEVDVVITHRKGEFCRVVDADYYIDDKSENVDCAIWMTDKKTKSYVITRPYNSGVYAPHSKSARRVSTLSEFLEDLNGE